MNATHRLAAQKFGVEFFETTISGDEFVGELPRFIWHAEEPICKPPGDCALFRFQTGERARQGGAFR